jgi:D-glycero-D-manno-heptose 1,7-bisphosphate phosphatase
MRPGVFLDRDDTIIDNKDATAHTAHPGDLLDPGLVRLLPGAGEALAELHTARLPLIVVTNQGGVAQGYGTLRDVEAVNDRMRELLARFGVVLAGVYYSPARGDGVAARFRPDPRDPVPWRKPGAGMLVTAAAELGLDLARSWMIGDAPRDVEAGVRAGLMRERCLLIGAGLPLADVAAAARVVMGQ